MTIANVSLLNTFDQWRVITNQSVYAVNDIENNNLFYLTSNTASLQVTGNVMRTGTVSIDPNLVTSVADKSTTNIASANLVNSVADIAYNFTNVVSTFANTLSVSLVGTISNTNAAFTRVNSVHNIVNTSYVVTNAAFSFANSVNAYAYAVAASANGYTDQQILIVDTKANGAYNKANDAYSLASLLGGNAAANIAILQSNFAIINTAYDTANAAFGIANGVVINAAAAFAAANNVAPQVTPAFNTANAAFNRANTVSLDLSNTATSVNAYTISVGAASNLWANIVGVRANTWANAITGAAFTVANAAYDTANGISTNTTAAFARANGAATNAAAAFNAANHAKIVVSGTLTDGASISWNSSEYQVATVTLGGNRTLANATGLSVGTYILHVYQDGAGNRTLNYGTKYKWPAGVTPVLSTTANAHDVFSFVCDGTNMYGSYMYDVK